MKGLCGMSLLGSPLLRFIIDEEVAEPLLADRSCAVPPKKGRSPLKTRGGEGRS